MMFKSEYNSELLPDGDDLLLSLSSRDEPSPSSSFGDLDPQQAEGGSSNPDSFPTVLYGIVSDESTDDCIRWLPCGTRFQITDKNKVRVFFLVAPNVSTSRCLPSHNLFTLSILPLPYAVSFQRRSYPFTLEVEVQQNSLVSPDG